ncbi:hypothetical protein EIN_251830 [Entamoeba invadens IP1]|uniref:Elongator complex protein 2 n=1 Tax=Entamoeba invadens IP1 TaxID=370355 RepID=A0A0A1UGM1_ENTIV|nr:hypothetical protein EIN_251830 [Entamoeba invadens IP1]ELP94999.1 hypothetical protein EIN_251830 [Entamoeba invadens IP1]|eukprot:XP_004261770.1 hypothetical protein EIN_251830 [Entamoeba invadens IP1]
MTTQMISLGPSIKTNLKFSKDGKFYFYGNLHAVGIVSVDTNTVVQVIDFRQSVRSIEVMDEQTIVIGTERGLVYTYNYITEQRKKIVECGEMPVINLEFYSSYLLIVTPMRILLIQNGDVIDDISSDILIETAVLLRNEHTQTELENSTTQLPTIAYALTDASGTLVLKTGKNERRIPGNKTWVTVVRQSVENDRIFIGTDAGKVIVHKYPSLEVESVVPVSDLRISGISCHNDNTFIVSSIDCSIQIFQLSDLWLSTLRLGGVGEERYIRFAFSEKTRILIALSNLCHLHGWKLDSKYSTPTQIVLPTGHSLAVSSVELYKLPTIPENLALISSSEDFTVRVFVKTPKKERSVERWVEVARPLVHGYPLTRAVMIDHPLRILTSSVEEKPIRVLETSKYFIDTVRYVTNSNFSREDMLYYDKSPIGANHQPLSLTNTPLREHTGSSRQSRVQSPTKPQFDLKTLVVPDSDEMPIEDIVVASVPKIYTSAPPEEELHYHTLWPETNKLLEQQSEVVQLEISKDEQFIATGGLYLKPSQFTKTVIPAKTVYLWKKDGESYKVLNSYLPFEEEDEIEGLIYDGSHIAVGGKNGKVAIINVSTHTMQTVDVSTEKISGMCSIGDSVYVGTPSGQCYKINKDTGCKTFWVFLNKAVSVMRDFHDNIVIGYEDGSIDFLEQSGEGKHFQKDSNGKVVNCCPSKVLSLSVIEFEGKPLIAASDDIGTIIVFSL